MNPTIATLTAMQTYGGSFVRKLLTAWFAADPQNRRRIEAAFPEIFAHYAELAAQDPEAA